MTRAQALKRARKAWGKTAFVTLDSKAVVGEERATLLAEFARMRDLYKKFPEKSNNRRVAYQEFRRLQGIIISRRCGVGYVHDSFLGPIHSTNGSGDTWEEACDHARI